VVGFGDPAGDRKAKAGATCFGFDASAGFVGAKEPFEDARLQLGGNSLALIGDTNPVMAAIASAGEFDARVGRGIFDGVIKEVEEHTAEESFVGSDGEIGFDVRVEGDVLRGGEGTGPNEDLGSKLVEISFAKVQRVLASVGAGQREEVLDDVRQALRFVAKDGQGFAVVGEGAIVASESDFGFTAKNGDRSAELMRSVGDEAALLLERSFEALKKFVKAEAKLAKLVATIFDGEAVVEIGGAYGASLRGHSTDGSEALARQKVAPDASKKQGNGNGPVEGMADVGKRFHLRMQRLQHDQCVVAFRQGDAPYACTETAAS